jgi:DnaJ-class molecular chaperone
LKLFHPDKASEKEYDNEYFLLINYAYKLLDNPITKKIYDEEGHRGLKIYYNNYYEIFEKMIRQYACEVLNYENEESIELIDRIMKKIRKIKFDLMKTNFQKYTKSSLEIENTYDLSSYMSYKQDDKVEKVKG